jgi:hypothetical protein
VRIEAVGNAVEVDDDDRSQTELPRLAEPAAELQIVGAFRQHDPSAAVQPDDLRGSGERAAHDHDAAVLAQVSNRLDAAAEVVEVPDRQRPEYRERPGHALR